MVRSQAWQPERRQQFDEERAETMDGHDEDRDAEAIGCVGCMLAVAILIAFGATIVLLAARGG